MGRRALVSRVDAMRLVVCASETYNQRNVRRAVADSVAACEAIVVVAVEAEIPVEVEIGVAFGCSFVRVIGGKNLALLGGAAIAGALAEGEINAEEKELIENRLGESGLAPDRIKQIHKNMVFTPYRALEQEIFETTS